MTKQIFSTLSLVRDERGQDLIEYALLAAFIAVAAGSTLPNVGGNISAIFSRIQSLMR